MRERRPQDWVTDLAGRHSLEQRMALALAGHPDCVLLKRATSSLDELDYAIAGPGDRLGQVELKPSTSPIGGGGTYDQSWPSSTCSSWTNWLFAKSSTPVVTPTWWSPISPGGAGASGRRQSSYWPLRPAQCVPWLQALTAKRPRSCWTCEKHRPGDRRVCRHRCRSSDARLVRRALAGHRAVASRTGSSRPISEEDIMTHAGQPQLLSIDEACNLIGSSAIALVDAIGEPSERLPTSLAGGL